MPLLRWNRLTLSSSMPVTSKLPLRIASQSASIASAALMRSAWSRFASTICNRTSVAFERPLMDRTVRSDTPLPELPKRELLPILVPPIADGVVGAVRDPPHRHWVQNGSRIGSPSFGSGSDASGPNPSRLASDSASAGFICPR
jgi:hypothetical protein